MADEWNRYAEAFRDAGIRVFLAVIEAFRIGDSAPGFRFRLIAGPNEWKIATTSNAARSAAQNQRQEANLAFWTAFLPIANQRTTVLRSIGPRTGPYVNTNSGSWSFQVWVLAETCRVQLRIDSSDVEENAEIFTRLKSDSEAIEAAFGDPLLWDDAEEARACFVRYEFADGAGWRTDERERAEGISRTADALGRLHEALEPFLSGL